jgi:chromosomal replication initiation ATPase DnaA
MDRHDLEDEITRYLAGQIEDGKLDAEGMARRLTRYGLMLPSDFTAEIHERAEQTDD